MPILRFAALLLVVANVCFAQTAPKPAFISFDPGRSFRFVMFGDLRTAPLSDKESTDPVRRKAIIDAITMEKPAFIAVTGDLVVSGSDAENWAEWDVETADWKKAKIPVFPALGNHDLNSNRDKALDNYFQRFPQLGRSRYYAAKVGNVLLLTLDSSLPELEGPQSEWMKATFDSLPNDVDFVVLSLHHPPMTKSHRGLLTGHPARPEEIALGQWLEARQKTLRARIVVVAGHVHNYERYEGGGVTYLVSGGGGATPYPISRDAKDDFREKGSNYHYCTAEVRGGHLTVEMHKLEYVNGVAEWRVADRFEVEGNPKRAGASASESK